MKLPVPLATVIAPPKIRYFADEPAGATVADPGAGNGAGGGGDPNADIMDFTAPDIAGVGDFLAGKSNVDPVATPPAPKPTGAPAAKPTEPPKPATPPVTPKPGEPPAKQLREELDAVKRERDELKTTLEKGDPKLVEAEKAVKAKETEIADYKAKVADYEKRLALSDPKVTAKLRDLDAGYDKEAGKFYQSVPELDTRSVNSLVEAYHALPFGKPEYRQARADFEAKVNEALGAADGSEHRKLSRALDFIERTHEFALERPGVEKEVRDSALKVHRDSQVEEFTKMREFVTKGIERARQIPDGMRETNPYHPKVVLDAFDKVLPPEQVEKFTKGIPEFIELVTAGAKPRSDSDYAGMTAEQIAESQANEAAHLGKMKEAHVEVLYNGLRALRAFPTLMREYQRLREKVKEDADGNPPDPTAGGGGGGGATADDIKNFKAPDLGAVEF